MVPIQDEDEAEAENGAKPAASSAEDEVEAPPSPPVSSSSVVGDRDRVSGGGVFPDDSWLSPAEAEDEAEIDSHSEPSTGARARRQAPALALGGRPLTQQPALQGVHQQGARARDHQRQGEAGGQDRAAVLQVRARTVAAWARTVAAWVRMPFRMAAGWARAVAAWSGWLAH